MKSLINNKGITLIALVITVIVILILAGIAIANLTGNNSITERAQEAKKDYEAAQVNETKDLSEYENHMGRASGGSSGSMSWRGRGLNSPNLVIGKKYSGDLFGSEQWIIIQSDGSLLSTWAGTESAETIQGYIDSGDWEVGSDYIYNGEGAIFKVVSGALEIYLGGSKAEAYACADAGVPNYTLTLASE